MTTSLRFSPRGWDAESIPPMEIPRYEHAAVVVGSSLLVVLGGTRRGYYLSSVECLDLSDPSAPLEWKRLPDMLVNRTRFAAACYGTKIYVFGGSSESDRGRTLRTIDVLDLANLHMGWTTLSSTRMSVARHSFAGATRGQYFYITGGCLDYHGKPLCSVEVFDMQAESFLEHIVPDFWRKRHLHAASVVETNTATGTKGGSSHLLVVGGSGGGGARRRNVYSSVKAFDFESQRWISRPEIPHWPREQLCAAALGEFMVIAGGGEPFHRYNKSVLAFHSDTRQWLELPSMNVGRERCVGAAVAGNKVIVAGGIGGRGELSSCECLDVAPGLPWEKEKLLLLCFKGKALNKEGDGACLLQNLELGTFGLILQFLLVPLDCEINQDRSIFRDKPGSE
jgi:N-acetylneuraminic acid mutarotase